MEAKCGVGKCSKCVKQPPTAPATKVPGGLDGSFRVADIIIIVIFVVLFICIVIAIILTFKYTRNKVMGKMAFHTLRYVCSTSEALLVCGEPQHVIKSRKSVCIKARLKTPLFSIYLIHFISPETKLFSHSSSVGKNSWHPWKGNRLYAILPCQLWDSNPRHLIASPMLTVQ